MRTLLAATIIASAAPVAVAQTPKPALVGVEHAMQADRAPRAKRAARGTMMSTRPVAKRRPRKRIRAAQQRAEELVQTRDATTLALVRTLDERMTVWKSPKGSRRIHVSHCRSSGVHCEARIAAIATLIVESSRRHNVDPFLVAAMALRESGLNPFAAGGVGERGLVQLHPRGVGSRVRFVKNETYRQKCAKQPDACQSEVLEVGVRLVASSIQRCGTVREGLGAYNSGHCQSTGYSERVMSERAKLVGLAKKIAAERYVAAKKENPPAGKP